MVGNKGVLQESNVQLFNEAIFSNKRTTTKPPEDTG